MDISKLDVGVMLKAFLFLSIPIVLFAIFGGWAAYAHAKNASKDTEKERIEKEREERIKQLMDKRNREMKELRNTAPEPPRFGH
ncbi:MAG: hypothetical protein ACOY3K_04875 [Candidatus Omnitrophota bacterium]